MEKHSCKKKHIHLISSTGALYEFVTSPIALVSHGRKQVVIQFLSNYWVHANTNKSKSKLDQHNSRSIQLHVFTTTSVILYLVCLPYSSTICPCHRCTYVQVMYQITLLTRLANIFKSFILLVSVLSTRTGGECYSASQYECSLAWDKLWQAKYERRHNDICQ